MPITKSQIAEVPLWLEGTNSTFDFYRQLAEYASQLATLSGLEVFTQATSGSLTGAAAGRVSYTTNFPVRALIVFFVDSTAVPSQHYILFIGELEIYSTGATHVYGYGNNDGDSTTIEFLGLSGVYQTSTGFEIEWDGSTINDSYKYLAIG